MQSSTIMWIPLRSITIRLLILQCYLNKRSNSRFWPRLISSRIRHRNTQIATILVIMLWKRKQRGKIYHFKGSINHLALLQTNRIKHRHFLKERIATLDLEWEITKMKILPSIFIMTIIIKIRRVNLLDWETETELILDFKTILNNSEGIFSTLKTPLRLKQRD